MGLFDRLFGSARAAGRSLTEPLPDGSDELHVNDPRFDDWPVVRDFETLADGRAWLAHLEEAEIAAVLTSDWPLDDFGRGEISLCVPPGRYSDADELLSDYDF